MSFSLGQSLYKLRSYMVIIYAILLNDKKIDLPVSDDAWIWMCRGWDNRSIVQQCVVVQFMYWKQEEDGRSRRPQGKSWVGGLSTQQISLAHKLRLSQCPPELSKADASTEEEGGKEDVLLVCWRSWLQGGRRNENTWESTAEQSGVLILVRNFPSISRTFSGWRDRSGQQYLASSSITTPVCLLCC